MSTSGHVQYISGYPVHQRNTISTLGGGREYHEYIGRCSAHQRDIMMHLGEQLNKSFQFLLKTPMYS